jgi:hypothetical protein
MTDYSFMKTGFNTVNDTKEVEIDLENIEILLSVFINNALKNAAKYSTLCKRNGVTTEDIKYSLKYEVFEFLNTPNLKENIENARKEYYEDLENEEYSDDEYSDDEDEDGDKDKHKDEAVGDEEDGDEEDGEDDTSDKENIEDIIVPDDQIEDFKRVKDKYITDENREFVEKYHRYYDTWSEWTPTDKIEMILKNAIDKINI